MDINKTKLQKKVIDSLVSPVHGILLIAPRVGKTKLAIDIIKKEKCKSVLWVTPSTKLKDVDIPKEFLTWKSEKLLGKVTIICWKALEKHKGNYDKIILDEYQYITKKNISPLFNKNIIYNTIIGLSGTHPKNLEKKLLLSKLSLKILLEIDIEEAISKKVISDYQIVVVETDLDNSIKNIIGGTKKKPFFTTESRQYSYLTNLVNRFKSKAVVLKRMHMIYNSPSKERVSKFLLNNLKGRKIIFSGSIEQSESFSKNTFNSKTDSVNLNLFQEGKLDILSLVRSGGVGFTYRNVDHFILNQVDSDSRGESTQKLTRALLSQKGYKAQIWIISLVGTQDEVWVKNFLENFDQNKIEYKRFVHLEKEL